jgi:hypothetical protein
MKTFLTQAGSRSQYIVSEGHHGLCPCDAVEAITFAVDAG